MPSGPTPSPAPSGPPPSTRSFPLPLRPSSNCSNGDEAPGSHRALPASELHSARPHLDVGLRRRLLAGAPSLAPSGMPPSTRPFALPLRTSSACSDGDEAPWPRPSSARPPLHARVRTREGAGRQQLASIGSKSRRRATAHRPPPVPRGPPPPTSWVWT